MIHIRVFHRNDAANLLQMGRLELIVRLQIIYTDISLSIYL